MNAPIEYSATSMVVYDLDGELMLVFGTNDGRCIKISAGILQALTMNAGSASYIAKHYRDQEADAV